MVALALLAACDDGDPSPGPDTVEDGLDDSAGDTTLADSSEDLADTDEDTAQETIDPPFEGLAGVIAATSGEYSPFAIPAGEAPSLGAAVALGTRAPRVSTSSDGDVLVIELGGTRVVRLGAAPAFEPVDTVDLASGSDPVAAEVIGDTIVISLASRPELVLDEQDSQRVVDLSSIDDPDGNPDAGELIADGDRVLVALSRLDAQGTGLAVGEPAQVAVVDPTTGTIIDTIELPATDARPGFARVDGDTLAIGVAGHRTQDAGGGSEALALDGAIVFIERDAAGGYVLGETLATEAELAGTLIDFVLTDESSGVALVADLLYRTTAVAFERDEATGTLTTRDLETPAIGLAGRRLCRSPDGTQIGIVGESDAIGRGVEGIFVLDANSLAQIDGSPIELDGASDCALSHPR